jgi:hypothetical protein
MAGIAVGAAALNLGSIKRGQGESTHSWTPLDGECNHS